MASHTLKWLKAAWMKEFESWKNLNVYEEVDDVGQKAISSCWVYTEKMSKGERIKKAHLAACGFEEDIERIPIDLPTCNKESL